MIFLCPNYCILFWVKVVYSHILLLFYISLGSQKKLLNMRNTVVMIYYYLASVAQ